MQQQMFQQQMQMQMSAMEKHTETSEKYLWRIAKSMTSIIISIRGAGLIRRMMIA
jgi:hypothetical protein